MTQERLSNNDFLERLTSLLRTQSSRSKGSLYMTQKRLTQDSEVESAPQPHHKTPKGAPQFSDLSPASTLPVLFRVTDGKSKEHRSDKVKIATVVEPGDLDGFFVRYAEVCRAGMDALKKRDRSKGKKRKKDKKSKDGGPSKT